MRYPVATDGDKITPVMRGYRMMCCDCSLVHVMNFTVTHHGRGHKVHFTVRRDKRATAQARRRKKK
jgi:hypothetical protein